MLLPNREIGITSQRIADGTNNRDNNRFIGKDRLLVARVARKSAQIDPISRSVWPLKEVVEVALLLCSNFKRLSVALCAVTSHKDRLFATSVPFRSERV